MRSLPLLLSLPGSLITLATANISAPWSLNQSLSASNDSGFTNQTTNLSIPLRPEQLPPSWHLTPLSAPATIPVLSIYTTLLLWVNIVWQFCLGWLDPIPSHSQCDAETGTCITFTSFVSIRKVEAAWLAIAMWENNLNRLGPMAEQGVWRVKPTRITYMKRRREEVLGKIGFAVQIAGGGMSSDTWVAMKGEAANGTFSAANFTDGIVATVRGNALADRISTGLYPLPPTPGGGFNVNSIGEIIIRSMIETCWSRHSDEIPKDRVWTGSVYKGGRMAIRMRETKVWGVEVTYALVAEGLHKLLKKVTHGFVGEISGTLGLMNDQGHVAPYADVEVRAITNGDDGKLGGDHTSIEDYQ